MTYEEYEGESEEEIEVMKTLKLALYLNMAICYLRLNDSKNSKAACEEALKIDPKNTKALYRRAKAITADINSTIDDYRAGLEDLNKAAAIDPSNTDIQQEIVRFKKQIAKIVADENKVKGFLNKAAESKSQSTKEKEDRYKGVEENYQGIQGANDVKVLDKASTTPSQQQAGGDAKTESKKAHDQAKDTNHSPVEAKRSETVSGNVKEAKPPSELKDLEKYSLSQFIFA